MAEVILTAPRRRRWPRIFGWTLLILLVLLIILYFVATSSAFFKGVILPRVSRSLNANITVADASISPFSHVILRHLKVRTTGPEPLLAADEARVVYHLGDILRGNYHIEELTLASPNILIIKNPDGTSNLDPLTQAKKPTPQKAGKKPSAPAQIDIKSINLNNATVRMIQNQKDGSHDLTELSNANLALTNLKNGQTGKLTFASDIGLDNHAPAPGTNSLLQAKAAGSFNLALAQDLKSAAISGNAHTEVQKAEGSLADLAGLVANLDCDITPTDIKQVALRFQKSGNNLGELRASGPFDMAKTEGQLTVEASSIDHNLLNLLGASSGTGFGSTSINSTNHIDLASGGSLITALGQLNVASMTLIRKDLATPTVDLHADYNVSVDRANKTALLRNLVLNGTQNRQPLLQGELTSPMSFAWGGASNAVGDSTLKLALTRMNLPEWKSLLGNQISDGLLNLTANLTSQQGGEKLTFDLTSAIDNLSGQFGSNHISQATINFQSHGQATALDKFDITDFRAELSQQTQPALSLSGSGQYEKKLSKADLQIVMDSQLPRLFQVLAQPDVSADSGTLQLKGHVLSQGDVKTLVGHLTLTGFTGRYGKSSFTAFGTDADLDLAANKEEMQIRKAAGTLSENARPGGRFEATGDYDTAKKSGQLAFKLTDINENGLRPFLASALGDKQLVSAALNGNSTAHYAAQGETSLKADFQLANLVVHDPKNQLPASPLEARFQMDASLRNQVIGVHQFQLNLTPTPRATNELTLTGQVDLSQTNAIQGNLNLASQALDLTHYYDLIENKSKAAPATPAQLAAPAPTPAPAAYAEPPPKHLPFRNFNFAVNIAHLYLREVDIADWQTTAKLDADHLILKPCQLTLNGAPVNASLDLNLGIPGYQYDLAFNANRIPLAPLANSFSSTYKGRAKGELLANAQIKGAGTTGTSLQKTLNGQVSLTLTNSNIELAGSKVKMIITPIATALRLPELLQSPITWLAVDAKIGNGVISLNQFKAVGSAFSANSQGTITIASVLTNSTINNLPLNISLPVSLANKAKLAPANMSTNAAYVDLGKLATVSGTIAAPKTQPDYVAIGTLTARGLGGSIGGEAGKILKGAGGLGGILSGQQPAATNQPGANPPPPNPPPPNPPAPNQPGKLNPFDLFHKVLPK